MVDFSHRNLGSNFAIRSSTFKTAVKRRIWPMFPPWNFADVARPGSLLREHAAVSSHLGGFA